MADASTTDSDEIWKAVPGWEGLYEASSLGRVRRLPGFVRGRGSSMRPIPGGIRNTPIAGKNGYRNVMLCDGGRIETILLHIVICRTFHGLKPSDKHQVAHWDGDPANNRADNLRWATAKENADDRARHGRTQLGDGNANAKLTSEDVIAIRSKYADGSHRICDLANMFGVTWSQILHIVKRKQWKHV